MVNWQTFIVRFWQESSSGTWRGQIVHLPDQDSRHFATIAQAMAFMAEYVSGLNPPNEGDEGSPAHLEEEP